MNEISEVIRGKPPRRGIDAGLLPGLVIVTLFPLWLAAQTMGNEAAMQVWLRCSVDTYKAESELVTFDRAALVATWAACSDERDAVIETTPKEQRDLIGRMLEGVHDSVIAEIVAGDNQHPGYGLSRERPVGVGGSWQEGVMRAREYLGQLRGPNGETPVVTRIGSCCAFPTPNAMKGGQGRLEVYDLSMASPRRATIVYVNTYDEADLGIVEGFKKVEEVVMPDAETIRR